jgi:hypothetical protein
MSYEEDLNKALPRTPRLISIETGYDWREFDRWLQQIQKLLGSYEEGINNINLFTGHIDNRALISSIGMISTATTKKEDVSASDMTTLMPSAPSVSTRGITDDIMTLYWIGV